MAQEKKAAAPAADLVTGLLATRRVEHDGVSYGPGLPDGDALPPMPRAAAEALVGCGAAAPAA